MNEYISREAVLEKAKSSISVPTDNEWDCGYNTAMAEMREFIKQLPSADVQPINLLVKVEERVPDVSGNYLCYLSNSEFEVLYFDRGIEDDEYNNDYPFGVWNTYPSDDGGECREWIEVLEVTHWQPLPEPPEV